MTPGIVIAPRIGGAWIRVGTRTVFARNDLNLRAPPGARVLVAQDGGRFAIVGRER